MPVMKQFKVLLLLLMQLYFLISSQHLLSARPLLPLIVKLANNTNTGQLSDKRNAMIKSIVPNPPSAM